MATEKQKRAAKILADNPRKSVSGAMREAGYSPETAKNPSKLTGSKEWPDLLEEYLPDSMLGEAHKALLNSNRVDHMVFPTNAEDEEIEELLASTNCVVKKIMHGDQATHVWFWSPDNKARKDGLDMAYKLKGHYKPEKFEDTSKSNLSEEELDERIAKRLAAIKQAGKATTSRRPAKKNAAKGS